MALKGELDGELKYISRDQSLDVKAVTELNGSSGGVQYLHELPASIYTAEVPGSEVADRIQRR